MVAVRFRGFDPRTRLARWGLLAAAVGIVLGATGPTLLRDAVVAVSLRHDSVPWYTLRVAGFLAYLALSGSVVYGLLMSTRLLDVYAHRPISFALHQDLASVGLGLGGVHGILLLLDRTVHYSLPAVLIPGLSPYRWAWVALGEVAFYLMLAVVASFYLRRRIGQRAWRAMHYTTFLAFATASAHGLLAGTDTPLPWAWEMYLGTCLLVLSLLAFRVLVAARRARAAAL